ncbi:MAG: hypothetical protein LBH66_01555 [Oscillospiraceae bacterium]|nr:hypothetical protein [Oscillospiraceae bacterium]
MQYSQEQLQSILNNMYGTTETAPNQDENGCPWANQHCCPSCGVPANCPSATAPAAPAAPQTPPTAKFPVVPPGFSTSWPFFPGFPGGNFPPAPPSSAPSDATSADIPPNQDDNGCPWANQHCCPSCGVPAECLANGNGTAGGAAAGAGTAGGSAAANSAITPGMYASIIGTMLNQNPLFTNALSPTVFPTDAAPNQDENGCPLINGCSVYGFCR